MISMIKQMVPHPISQTAPETARAISCRSSQDSRMARVDVRGFNLPKERWTLLGYIYIYISGQFILNPTSSPRA